MFGRKLKDTLPYSGLQAGPMIHINKHIDKLWRDTWDLKERALRRSYLRNVEKLDKHSKLQEPLKVGDKVLVHNQVRRFATKREKTSTVVETHDHDQYSVKIDGSGRFTLRNRQFLGRLFHTTYLASQTQLKLTSQAYTSHASQDHLPLNQLCPVNPHVSLNLRCHLFTIPQQNPNLSLSSKSLESRNQ